jgi:hypothetical protein
MHNSLNNNKIRKNINKIYLNKWMKNVISTVTNFNLLNLETLPSKAILKSLDPIIKINQTQIMFQITIMLQEEEMEVKM